MSSIDPFLNFTTYPKSPSKPQKFPPGVLLESPLPPLNLNADCLKDKLFTRLYKFHANNPLENRYAIS